MPRFVGITQAINAVVGLGSLSVGPLEKKIHFSYLFYVGQTMRKNCGVEERQQAQCMPNGVDRNNARVGGQTSKPFPPAVTVVPWPVALGDCPQREFIISIVVEKVCTAREALNGAFFNFGSSSSCTTA